MKTSIILSIGRKRTSYLLNMLVLFFSFSVISFSQALSGTYTIGPGGDFTTFSAAADTLQSRGVSGPVVFNVLSGTYSEQFTLDYVPDADETHTITFQSLTGDSTDVILKYDAGGDADNFLMTLKRCRYVTFRGMTFQALDKTYNRIITIEDYAEYLTIENCVFKGRYNTNAVVRGAHIQASNALLDHLKIRHNHFSRASYGIFCNSSGKNNLYPEIQYNRFDSTGYCAVYLNTAEAPRIMHNAVNYATYGMHISTSANATVIQSNILKNVVFGMHLTSLKSASGYESFITNNLIAANRRGRTGIEITHSYYFNVYNNTVLVNDDNKSCRALSLEYCTGSTVNVLNNNLVSLNDGVAIYVGNTGDLHQCDYNNFYTPGRIFAYWNDHGECEDFRTLKMISGDNARSVFAFPYFVSDTDLHPRSAWLDGKGVQISGVTEDADGNIRDNPPDIGCYEFTATSAVKPPLSGTKTIGPGGDYETLGDAIADARIKGVSDSLRLQFLTGTYGEQCVITPIAGASSEHPVILESVTGKAEDVHIRYQAVGSEDNFVLQLKGSSFIHIRDLTLEAAGPGFCRVFELRGMVDSLQVESCVIAGTPQGDANRGGRLVFSNHLNFHHITFHGNTFLNGSTTIILNLTEATTLPGELEILNNTFPGNGYQAVYLYRVESPVIADNFIYGSDFGISISLATEKLLIKNNYIHTLYGHGIHLNSCSLPVDRHGRIYNNFIVCNGTSPNRDVVEVMNCELIEMYYNSISNHSNSSKSRPLYIYAGQDLWVKNNIFSNEGSEMAINVMNVTPSSFPVFDYNCLYTEGPVLGYWNQECADLDAIKAASGKNEHSLDADPLFVSDTNLHVTSLSLDSAAAPVSWILTDYDGDMRNSQFPDIGADEFGGGMNHPPLAVNDTATVIKGEDITIDLLQNDRDPDNDSVYISWLGSPLHGSIHRISRGVIYTAEAGYEGWDSLFYVVSDIYNARDTAWLFVRVRSRTFTIAMTDMDQIGPGNALWCDFDMDGDLDVSLAGRTTERCINALYSSEFFLGPYELFGEINPGWVDEAMIWGDYDNDGDPDLIIAGVENYSHKKTYLYSNQNAHMIPVSVNIEDVEAKSVDWGDFDNDGDIDLLITGILGKDGSITNRLAKLYRNDGAGAGQDGSWVFTEFMDLGASYGASAKWGDYDLDGDLDILYSNQIGGGGYTYVKIYRNNNNGSSFTKIDDIFPYVIGNAGWIDYDNDGDLDIFTISQWPFDSLDVINILRNDPGPGGERVFVKINTGIQKGYNALSADWGDYDGDGDADLILTGFEEHDTISRHVTRLYENLGDGRFKEVESDLPDVCNGTAQWGDFNRDGKPDILLTGTLNNHYGNPVTEIYLNNTSYANTAPEIPQNLRCELSDTLVRLIWSPATDDETPSAGLTYNLRIGTTPGGSEVMSAMADPVTGTIFVPQTGNAGHNTFYILKGLLKDTTYYWSVQAVDPGYMSSAFSPEQSFTITSAYDIGLEFYDLEDTTLTRGKLIVAHRKENEQYCDHTEGRDVIGTHMTTVEEFPAGAVTASYEPDRDDYPGLIRTYLGGVAFFRDAAWLDLQRDTSGVQIHVLKVKRISGTNTITGTLINSSDSSALYQRWVFLVDQNGEIVKFDVTDDAGRFTFDSIPPGHYYFDADFWYWPMDENNDSVIIAQENQVYSIAGVLKDLKISIVISNVTGRRDLTGPAPVTVWPNPVQEDLYLRFDKPQERPVTVRITGMDGRVRKSLHFATVPAGAVVVLPAGDLPPGVYILSVQGEKMNYKTRIIRIR